jgi:hypothetical protein
MVTTIPTSTNPARPPTKARAMRLVSIAFSLLSFTAQICDTSLHNNMTYLTGETKILPLVVIAKSIDLVPECEQS